MTTSSRLGQAGIPPELASIIRLFTHLRATDPERFVVATTPTPDHATERVVGFASAVVRETLWYLSMLFVLPEFQGAGLGRALLAQVLPNGDGVRSGRSRPTAPSRSPTPCMPSYGVVPRMPLLNLNGLPSAAGGIRAVAVGHHRCAVRGDRGRTSGRRRSSSAARCRRRARPRQPRRRPPARASIPADGGPPRLAVPRARTAFRSATDTPGEAGRLGPVAALDAERCSRRSSAISPRRSCHAGRSRCGSAAPRTGRSSPASRRASGSMASRSCSAGTGRSPISRRYLPISPGLP